MPLVPKSERKVFDQVGPSVSLNSEASREAFGGGASQQRLQSAAQGLVNTYEEEKAKAKAKADQIRMYEERRALNDWEHEKIYGQEGAINRRGKDALNVYNDVQKGFDEFVNKRMEQLSDDDQRAALRQMSESRRQKLLSWADGHTNKQIEVYEEGEFQSSLESSKERASLDLNNVKTELAFQSQAILEKGEEKGWSKEQTNQELQKHRSDLYTRVVKQMVSNGNDLDASNYFKEVKEEMDPDQAAELSRVLEAGNLLGEGQRRSDAILAKNLSMTDSYKEAAKIKDPKVRREVESQIGTKLSRREAADRELDESRFLEATNIIEETGEFSKIPAEMLAQMPLSQRSSLKAYAAKKASGADFETNWGEYQNLKAMASTPELRNDFLKKNIAADYREKLANSELKEMIKLQTDLRDGNSDTEKLLRGYRTHKQIVDDTLRQIGIDTGRNASQSEIEDAVKFKRLVDEQIIDLQERTGKKATNDDVQSIVDGLTIKAIRADSGYFGFFRDERRIFQFNPNEEILVTVDDIPKRDRQKISEALQRRGQKITDEAMIELYSRMRKGIMSRAK